MIATVQDRVLAVFAAVGELVVQNFRYHAFSLVLTIAATHDLQRTAVAELAPQAFFVDVRIIGDKVVGAFQNAARGAVVLFQLDHLEAWKILLQAIQVFRVGATPGINGLVVVANGGEGRGFADQ